MEGKHKLSNSIKKQRVAKIHLIIPQHLFTPNTCFRKSNRQVYTHIPLNSQQDNSINSIIEIRRILYFLYLKKGKRQNVVQIVVKKIVLKIKADETTLHQNIILKTFL